MVILITQKTFGGINGGIERICFDGVVYICLKYPGSPPHVAKDC